MFIQQQQWNSRYLQRKCPKYLSSLRGCWWCNMSIRCHRQLRRTEEIRNSSKLQQLFYSCESLMSGIRAVVCRMKLKKKNERKNNTVPSTMYGTQRGLFGFVYMNTSRVR